MDGAKHNLPAASSANSSMVWVEVLVDCPGASGLYTYEIPPDLMISAGDIVSVPFGRQKVGAIAIQIRSDLPDGLSPSSIKSIEAIVKKAFFTKEYWQLLNRVGDYYQTPFIKVIRTALPPGLLSKSQRRIRLCRSLSDETLKQLQVSPQKMSAEAYQLLEILHHSPNGDYSWQHLRRQIKFGKGSGRNAQRVASALRQLTQQGWVESYLAAPRSVQPQKRQAVLLLQLPPEAADNVSPGDSTQPSLSQRQRDILLTLQQQGGELWLSDALQVLHTTSKTLKKIEALGYLSIESREVLRSGSHSSALPDQPKTLTSEQSVALDKLQSMQGYEEALLHGVTGSGKTEVYLQAIAPYLKAQKSALVLVPEIGLTPQLTDRFRSRFGKQVCVYHSGLSEGERYDTWRQMIAGVPQVVIGTRSAIFAPLPNLGIIILDEEHDSSFKQDQPMPCYDARLVARWRAELESCPLVLGSATPALESWVRFCSRTHSPLPHSPTPPLPPLHYLSLPSRVHARPLPPIEIVDMRTELRDGNRTIFSRPLQTALEELVEKGQQGILFIHRRGHSSFVSCRSCGHVMECPNCDVSLSFHQTHSEATPRLRCHYCGYSQRHPDKCPECQSPYLKTFGSGTQRVVNDLAKYLPQARCIRFDSDTTRNKGAHRALLTRFANGEADLLVGTQMLTKGIDLPQVTLVGVIAADGLLFMPDYRASERAFQTITQVAGRAGRGEQPGRVIVQTYSPEHAAIKALSEAGDEECGMENGVATATEEYGRFLQQEMRDRADLGYPPYGRLILLRLSGLDPQATENAAARLAHRLEADRQDHPIHGSLTYDILGPVPAPIFRVSRRYRWHILLKLSTDAPTPPNLVRYRSPKGVSLSIDVDPINLS
ncbi:MAG: primosomal protein N' [Cyanobacteria bacterium J06649_4]